MSLANKFRLINLVIIFSFLSAVLLSYKTNIDVFQKTDELANITKELDFLTSLKTTLANLNFHLYNYIKNHSMQEKENILKNFQELEQLVVRTKDFKLDEDEMKLVSYLRENISRFAGYVNNIISNPEKWSYYYTLVDELFKKVSEDINKHWLVDIKKVSRVQAESKKASERIFPAYIVLMLFLLIIAFAINRIITKRIIKPLKIVTDESTYLAGGDLDRRITIKTGDEIETLANNLNKMAEGLKEKIEALEQAVKKEQRVVRELAILNEFMGFISSEVEIDTILIRFAERSRDLLKAEYSALYMIEGGSGIRFYSTDKTLSRELLDEFIFKSDALNTTVDMLQIKRDNDLHIKLNNELFLKNMIFVPVGSTGDLKCILILFNKEGGFTQEDEDSIFSFSFQAFQTISLQYELARLATTDGLTGLYNHRMFQERLDEELVRAKRYNRKLFIMMIDIDHFKRFNDTYGHQTGDEVLKTVARLIKSNLRNIDFPARYGGEEFIVILPETECNDALRVGERLRKLVENYSFFVNEDEKARITISVGISCYPKDSTDKAQLVKMADEALYYAKKMGRNRVYLYSDIK